MATTKPVPKAVQKLPNAAPTVSGAPKGNLAWYPRNSQPDGRMFRPLPFVHDVKRGYIKEYRPAGPAVCYFLYNPNQFVYEMTVNQGLTAPVAQDFVPVTGPPGGTTVRFQLVFLRQFEVAYGGSKLGVWEDINALRSLIGITDPVNQGFGWLKTLMFVFGSDPSMVFYGASLGITVTLGLFSENMVPMAATVDMSVTWFPPGTLTATDQVKNAIMDGTGVTTDAAARQVPTNRLGPAIATLVQ